MSCPSQAALLPIVLGDVHADAFVLQHVQGCAACTRELSRLRETAAMLHVTDDAGPATRGCIDEVTIARIATDGLAQLDADVTAHCAECARCRAQVAEAISVLRTPDIAREVERLSTIGSVRRARRSWAWAGSASAAAALVIMVLAPQIFRGRINDAPGAARELSDRDATITMTLPPTIVAPIGSVAHADRFSWLTVPGTRRYAITVFDQEGSVVWQAETTDTALALPPAVRLKRGVLYLWKVIAHTSWNRSAESELVEFQLNQQER
jgi:hypothetical protein